MSEITIVAFRCSNTLDIKKPGTYKYVGYCAEDGSENKSDTAWRYFIIKRQGDTSACVLKDTLKDSCQKLDIPTVFSSSSFLKAIKIYPNPASNQVIISLKELWEEEVNVSLLDMSGREILQQRHRTGMQGDKIELNTSSIPNGLYLIEISMENGTFIERLSIAH